MGFVFQSYNLLPGETALRNVELPMVYANVGRKERRRRATEVLERVGLSGRIGHKPAELSGGQMQRVAIARALVNGPSLLLADEPTGNLDSASGAEIMDLFGELHESGATIMVVTHDPEVAGRSGRIVEIRDGRLFGAGGRKPAQSVARDGKDGRATKPLRIIGMGLSGLLGKPLRTGLAALGIVIGVAAVVTLTSLGNGIKDSVSGQITDLGPNLITVIPGSGPAP